MANSLTPLLLIATLALAGCAVDQIEPGAAPTGGADAGEDAAGDLTDGEDGGDGVDSGATDAKDDPLEDDMGSPDGDVSDVRVVDASQDASLCEGVACPAGEICEDGLCRPDGECPPEQMECDGACVDTSGDADHCGVCGLACDDPPDDTLQCDGDILVQIAYQGQCMGGECAYDPSTVAMQTCEFGCQDGACSPPECDSDGDCGSITFERVQDFTCRAIDGATADANFDFHIPNCDGGVCETQTVRYNLACRCRNDQCSNGVCDDVVDASTGCETQAHNGDDVTCPTDAVKDACL